jgi:hypothetical protein
MLRKREQSALPLFPAGRENPGDLGSPIRKAPELVVPPVNNLTLTVTVF